MLPWATFIDLEVARVGLNKQDAKQQGIAYEVARYGLGLNKILGTINTYPTMSEANKYAAGEWKRAHAPQKILMWLGKYHNWRRG